MLKNNPSFFDCLPYSNKRMPITIPTATTKLIKTDHAVTRMSAILSSAIIIEIHKRGIKKKDQGFAVKR